MAASSGIPGAVCRHELHVVLIRRYPLVLVPGRWLLIPRLSVLRSQHSIEFIIWQFTTFKYLSAFIIGQFHCLAVDFVLRFMPHLLWLKALGYILLVFEIDLTVLNTLLQDHLTLFSWVIFWIVSRVKIWSVWN